ncbi:unnamed protein product [Symbiodinium sp. CCMP2592]|nr:unnamed protein product [Symbiodinium sp. CCMP2592]
MPPRNCPEGEVQHPAVKKVSKVNVEEEVVRVPKAACVAVQHGDHVSAQVPTALLRVPSATSRWAEIFRGREKGCKVSSCKPFNLWQTVLSQQLILERQQRLAFPQEVPAPVTQEEQVHVPEIIAQTREIHQHVEQQVEVPVPMSQETVVHVPKLLTQTRVMRQHVEQAMTSAGSVVKGPVLASPKYFGPSAGQAHDVSNPKVVPGLVMTRSAHISNLPHHPYMPGQGFVRFPATANSSQCSARPMYIARPMTTVQMPLQARARAVPPVVLVRTIPSSFSLKPSTLM